MYYDKSYNNFMNDIISLQDKGEKYKFKMYAMEAFNTPSVKARIVELLYRDIKSTRNFNYNEIDNSKGDFTKFKYYELFLNNLNRLNKLMEDKKVPELDDLNRLHEMLIETRSDFEYGYRLDIDIIKAMYNTLVFSAMEYLNMCILAYVDYLKEVKEILFTFKVKNKNNIVLIKNVRYVITAYNNGDWHKIMKEFKGHSKNFAGLSTALYATGVILGIISATAAILIIAIGLFNAIRELTYLFYSKAYSISEWAEIQNKFLKENIKQESDVKALKKQRWLSKKLEGVSNFIETKIIKRNDEAKKKISKSNKEVFTKTELEKDTEFDQNIGNTNNLEEISTPPNDTIVF